ncbi:MAG: disulfide bond formation protein B [Candidatus Nanohalobium sp.]
MTEPLVFTFAAGTLATNIAIVVFLALKAFVFVSGRSFQFFERVEEFLTQNYRWIGFFYGLVASAGSLYLSNVLGWSPCSLCWFQRIFMYPLPLIFGVSLVMKDRNVMDYTVPLSILGGVISIRHYLVQRTAASAGCTAAKVSCETSYTFYFDYISVPFMALTGFAAVALTGILAAQKRP